MTLMLASLHMETYTIMSSVVGYSRSIRFYIKIQLNPDTVRKEASSVSKVSNMS